MVAAVTLLAMERGHAPQRLRTMGIIDVEPTPAVTLEFQATAGNPKVSHPSSSFVLLNVWTNRPILP
jgi:hypothetical protein